MKGIQSDAVLAVSVYTLRNEAGFPSMFCRFLSNQTSEIAITVA